MTLKSAIELAEELDRLSSGEIVHQVSNPSGRTNEERWTIAAYGDQRSGLNTAKAQLLLAVWHSTLIAVGARSLSEREKEHALRAVLQRTANETWQIQTQAMAGTPVQETWPVPNWAHGEIGMAHVAGGVIDAKGYAQPWAWAPFPARANAYVTILLKKG